MIGVEQHPGAYHCRQTGCGANPPPYITTEGGAWDWLHRHLTEEHGSPKRDAHQECDDRDRHLGRARLVESAGEIFRYWGLETFPADDAPGKRALGAVTEWIDYHAEADWFESLYIFGPPGTGKSGLAWAIATRFPTKSYWLNMRNVLADAKSRLSRGESFDVTDSPIFNRYGPDIVVLDDLGIDRPTAFAIETTAYIVEALHLRQVGMITTSNRSPSELANHLGAGDPVVGQRIVSRLTEGATKIKLDRADQRAKVKAA